MMRHLLGTAARLLAALVLVLLAAPAWPAASPAALLGVGGAIYRLQQGTYQQLFPGGQEAEPTNPVLALDVVHSGGEVDRFLVPGTEGPEHEASPALALDSANNGIFLVWEALRNIHSGLYLRHFSAGEWNELVEVSGNPFSVKSHPRLTMTAERVVVEQGENGAIELEQRILHLVWWDEAAQSSSIYMPIFLGSEGQSVRGPLFRLHELLPELPLSPLPPSPALLATPTVQPGGDRESAVITFTDPESGRLVMLEIRLTPGIVQALADEARAQVIIVGHSAEGQSPQDLAAAVRDRVLASFELPVGGGMLQFVLDRLVDSLAQADWDAPIESIADDARAQVIIVGNSLRTGLQNATGQARAQVIIVGATAGGTVEGTGPLTMRLLAHHEAPPAPGDTPLRVFASADGDEAIVAWERPGAVKYRERTAEGWSDTRVLALGDSLDPDGAYLLLEKRVQN